MANQGDGALVSGGSQHHSMDWLVPEGHQNPAPDGAFVRLAEFNRFRRDVRQFTNKAATRRNICIDQGF